MRDAHRIWSVDLNGASRAGLPGGGGSISGPGIRRDDDFIRRRQACRVARSGIGS
jgi:hypothetical protein